MEKINKTYQILKIKSKNNYKRIVAEIRKISELSSVYLERDKELLHVVIDQEKEPILEKTFEKIIKAIQKYEKNATIEELIIKETFRRVLVLKGLDCGHCATRIENLAKKNFNHEKIVIDFATERMIIETTDEVLAQNINEEVRKIAQYIDPKIEVMDIKTHKRSDFHDNFKIPHHEVYLFLVGILFLFFAFLNFNLFGIKINGIGFIDIIEKTVNHDDYTLSLYSKICLFISFLLVGNKVIIRFINNLVSGQIFDENFLMTVASIGAIFTGHNIEAVSVMVFYQIGSFLQERAVNRSRRSISELLSFEAKQARIKINNEITEVEVESILPGDIIVVRTGEIIPLDGIITEGKTYLDTKALTGESLYRNVKVKDEVLSGMINMGGIIEIKVSKAHGETTMSKILDMVENASTSKAKSEEFITKFARYYTPIVALLALLIAIFMPIISGLLSNVKDIHFHDSIYRAMVFLVISCPCALVISIPLSFFAGIGIASKQGILVKGSNYLEALNNVENVIFDKTGTLTKGEFGIKKVVSVNPNLSNDELERLVAYCEYYSTHPIGISIVDEYGRDRIFPEIIEEFYEYSGRGVRAVINGSRIMVGNTRLMRENKFEINKIDESGLVLHVTKERLYQGYVVIGDVIRDEAIDTIFKLRKKGIKKIYLLTGDSKGVAESVANSLDIDEVYYELLPNEKVDKLNEIRDSSKTKGKTIFIGDGINDAPVIGIADVGIAMGATGSEAAIAIADVVIMSDNLEKVNEAIKIARKTRQLVIENITLSLSVKAFVLLLGLFSKVTIWLAIFSDVGVSLIAILNAMRVMSLYQKKAKQKQIINTNEAGTK